MTFFTRYLYFWVRLKFLTMIIDSHVHFWEYDKKRQEWIGSGMKILQQDYLPQHLLPTLRRNGVDACIAVQSHPSELETRFISELAATHPFIKGVIGWIDLQADNIDAKLAEFAQYPAIKGYRYNFTETSNDALLEDHFAKAIQALQPYSYTFDLLLKPTQLTAAANLLTQFPDQHGQSGQIKPWIFCWHCAARWFAAIHQCFSLINDHVKMFGCFFFQ